MVFYISRFGFFLSCLLAVTTSLFGQEKFDIITFTTPKGWQKEVQQSAIQLGTQNAQTGGICLITIFKPVPGGADSKANFDAAWQSVVKEVVKPTGEPQMQPAGAENGWSIESGVSPYEQDGKQGVVLLVTATGGGKMVNILILTNTDEFEKDFTAFLASIVLPKVAADKASSPASQVQPSNVSQNPKRSNFKYNTTNFDDGWTAIEQEDWVRVTKGNLAVLLHYPHPREKEYISQQVDTTRTFWDLLVSPRYSNLRNFELKEYDNSAEPGFFAAGNVTDKATGKEVYVVFFSKFRQSWIEIIAPDKNAFVQTFGSFDPAANFTDWATLEKLYYYNRFAVDPSDLKGKWTTSFSNTTFYQNIYTGNLVGANTYSSGQTYNFGAGNSYSWNIAVANTSMGRTAVDTAKSAGTFSLRSNWEIYFSNLEGKPKTFPVHFSIVRGARILWIDGRGFGQVQ